jgi:hypothetical protein
MWFSALLFGTEVTKVTMLIQLETSIKIMYAHTARLIEQLTVDLQEVHCQ